jgi:hypothetical protein
MNLGWGTLYIFYHFPLFYIYYTVKMLITLVNVGHHILELLISSSQCVHFMQKQTKQVFCIIIVIACKCASWPLFNYNVFQKEIYLWILLLWTIFCIFWIQINSAFFSYLHFVSFRGNSSLRPPTTCHVHFDPQNINLAMWFINFLNSKVCFNHSI